MKKALEFLKEKVNIPNLPFVLYEPVADAMEAYAKYAKVKKLGLTKREAIAKDIVAALAPQFLWVEPQSNQTVGALTLVRVALDVTDELLKQLDQ